MLLPKKVKYRKMQKGNPDRGIATRKVNLDFGEYGLKALEGAWITARQIESARRVIIRYLRKGGKVYIRIFPDKPVTTKSAEVPMGGGKGTVDHYVAPIKAGTVLFEMIGVTESEAKEALIKAGGKMPVKTRFISKHQI